MKNEKTVYPKKKTIFHGSNIELDHLDDCPILECDGKVHIKSFQKVSYYIHVMYQCDKCNMLHNVTKVI